MSVREPPIRVVLADDHALVREGTAELLERAGGIRVVGQAADGLEAVRLVQALQPNVLLLDLALPGLDGLEVARRTRATSPSTAVVALTAHDEQAYVLAKGRPNRPARPLPDVLPWYYTGNRLHPTQKPVPSLKPIIEAFTRPGDVVLDPFCGSGSTLLAAKLLGRRYIGIELDARHCRTAKARL